MNSKGFMMAEVVVVSAIILVFLAGLYTSYNKLYSVYTSRLDYYDTVTLYKLSYYRDSLIENEENDLNKIISDLTNKNSYKHLNNDVGVVSGENVYIIRNERDVFDKNILGVSNQTFKDYLDFLMETKKSNDVSKKPFSANYLMVMERCITTDDCKYAYLEVYDGEE